MKEHQVRFEKNPTGSGISFHKKCPYCSQEMDLHGGGDDAPPDVWECKPCRHVEDFVKPEDWKVSHALCRVSLCDDEEIESSHWNWTRESVEKFWEDWKSRHPEKVFV